MDFGFSADFFRLDFGGVDFLSFDFFAADFNAAFFGDVFFFAGTNFFTGFFFLAMRQAYHQAHAALPREITAF